MNTEVKTKKMALTVTRESVNRYFPKIPLIPSSDIPVCLSCMGPAGYADQLDFALSPRPDCETDTTLLQLIPYISIVKADKETGKISIFIYKRGTASDEGRLIDKMSIGLGGHIEELPTEERSLNTIFLDTITRELLEEVGVALDDAAIGMIKLFANVSYLPIIYNDDDEVGKVHLGISVIIDISDLNMVLVGDEREVTESSFVLVEDVVSNTNIVMEKWSQIVLYKLASIINSSLQNDYDLTYKQYEDAKAALAAYSDLKDRNTFVYQGTKLFSNLSVDFSYTKQVVADSVDPSTIETPVITSTEAI